MLMNPKGPTLPFIKTGIAEKDIKANFRRYRTRFEEWLNE
jgi:hypothetical protein